MSNKKQSTASPAEAQEEKEKFKNVEPNIIYDPVDWTTIGKKQDSYNAAEKNRLEGIYSTTISNI
ncbi:MAG TPA: hypothetical protein VII99_06980, partial [Bacteroidia bacterium]